MTLFVIFTLIGIVELAVGYMVAKLGWVQPAIVKNMLYIAIAINGVIWAYIDATRLGRRLAAQSKAPSNEGMNLEIVEAKDADS